MGERLNQTVTITAHGAAVHDDKSIHLSVVVSGYIDRGGIRYYLKSGTLPLIAEIERRGDMSEEGRPTAPEMLEHLLQGGEGYVATLAAVAQDMRASDAAIASRLTEPEPICWAWAITAGDTCPECDSTENGPLERDPKDNDRVRCPNCGWFCYE